VIGELCQPISETPVRNIFHYPCTVADMRLPDNRPTGERPWRLPPDVDPDSLPAILARNLWALMASSTELKSQLALAKRAKVGQATIDRILTCTKGTRLDNLEKIAAAFEPPLQAWQLLLPGLDPTNPPVVSLTQTERELYERLTSVARQVSEHHDHRAGSQPSASPDRVVSSHSKGPAASKK
jgi:hypothetical protein